jgi:hypothetical protein
MATDTGVEEMTPLEKLKAKMITYSQYQILMDEQEMKLKNKPKPTGPMEHVDLAQADKEAAKWRRDHPGPTDGKTSEIPIGWTSAGKVEQPVR